MDHANPLDRNDGSSHSGASPLQTMGALVGLGLILLGVVFCVYLIVRVVGIIDKPEEFNSLLNRWELVVAGTGDGLGQGVTLEKSVRVEAPATADGESAPGTPQVIEHRVTLPGNPVRLAAMGFLFLLLMVLIRGAIGIITAGGSLVSLANPYRAMYEKTMKDFAAHRARHPGGHSRDFDAPRESRKTFKSGRETGGGDAV